MIDVCLNVFGYLARATSTAKVFGIFEGTVETVRAEVTKLALVSLVPMIVRIDVVTESIEAATIRGSRSNVGGGGGDV
ncbi:hypothetical protein PUN28_006330 [Cardiocondyla obscurior]|uniref:Uncharacterized protein n=1 Tax=Cardiocondyla obscurior TaxID=286306 RepID=A0AAW2G853_9HYME